MYRVKVHSKKREQQYSRCILSVSVGQPYHEGEKLRAAIAWVNRRFSTCVVCVADSLQRHNFVSPIASETSAHELTNALGLAWLRRNRSYLQEFLIPFSVSRWDEWLNHAEFQSARNLLDQYFLANAEFRGHIQHDTLAYLKNSNSSPLPHSSRWTNRFNRGLEYLLEEITVDSIISKDLPGEEVYPGSEPTAAKAMRLGTLHDLPPELTAPAFTRISFLRKKEHSLAG